MIFTETDGELHNTITPIARMRDGRYELDLVLRNNLTTKARPMGLYHPHEELHHARSAVVSDAAKEVRKELCG